MIAIRDIVSISQPFVRPVVRGKVSKPTEFGAKLYLSIDEYDNRQMTLRL